MLSTGISYYGMILECNMSVVYKCILQENYVWHISRQENEPKMSPKIPQTRNFQWWNWTGTVFKTHPFAPSQSWFRWFQSVILTKRLLVKRFTMQCVQILFGPRMASLCPKMVQKVIFLPHDDHNWYPCVFVYSTFDTREYHIWYSWIPCFSKI